MKDFFRWLSEQNEAMPYHGESPTPASNQVIRTGKQPQVGSGFEDMEKQQISNDSLLALDSQIQRLNLIIQDICDNNKIADCDPLAQSFKQFKDIYKKIKYKQYTHPEFQTVQEPALPNRVPSDQQRSLMQAEQPPRSEYPPMGGGVSDYTNTF